ncbi:MAG: hypothetical protein AMS22_00005 [Thiotrichales bacterium SG8_50]|nr:MAG: hypothetical protein AMS22_00005 [Thiotrichales bacterium SG8_50]
MSAGVILIAKTGTGIGPRASLNVAGILAVIAVLLYLAARFNGLSFAALSALWRRSLPFTRPSRV